MLNALGLRLKGTADRRFFACQSGSASIEAVLWFPVYIAVFTFMVDGTMIFHNHSQILRVVQDANRAYSIGRHETDAETESAVSAALASLASNATVNTTVNSGVIRTVVTVPAADLDMIGMFSGLASATVTVSAQHMKEE